MAWPLPAEPKALLLDCDGTLYSHRKLRMYMVREMSAALLRHGLPTVTEIRIVRAYRNALEDLRSEKNAVRENIDIRAEQLEAASRAVQQPLSDVHRAVATWIDERPLRFLPQCIRAGVVDLLKRSKQRGLKVAIVSDYPTERKLRAMGLTPYVDHMICSDDADVRRLKPHPASVQAALAHCSVSPEDAVFVGDREIDMLAARAAGVAGLKLSQGWTEHTAGSRTIRDFREIHRLIWPEPLSTHE